MTYAAFLCIVKTQLIKGVIPWPVQNKNPNQALRSASSMDADYLVISVAAMALLVNRQSLIFLCAFALSEIPHHLSTSPIYDNAIMASLFAITALYCKGIKFELQLALIWYSFLFLLSGVDFLLFPQITYFYVIFPYVIKIIDIYVLYHLINKERGSDRDNSTNRGTFNQWLSSLQLR